jgi:2-methylcitrate dehydratase PrpD
MTMLEARTAEELKHPRDPDPALLERYRVALIDWVACAVGGWPTATATRARELGSGLDDRLIALGTAGHVLDFDDTYAPGLSHVSAPIGPAVLVLGAERRLSLGAALLAFARGWEASAAFSEASHPGMRARGWHPTSVCGTVGAAVAAAAVLELSEAQEQHAIRLALLRAAGLRAAFGSDGKSLQVGFAAAAGVGAARLAGAGAQASAAVADGPAGFSDAYGSRVVLRAPRPAIELNWIKAYPCCLQTHSAIEAAIAAARAGVELAPGPVAVRVHPVSLQAAALDVVTDGLEAKFSIPYLTAFAYLYGAPGVSDFDRVDPGAATLARSITVAVDDSLQESEAVLIAGGEEVARIEAALGSPWRPMSAEQLAGKARALAGDRLLEATADLRRPVSELLEACAFV